MNSSQPLARQRFTIAHELAHLAVCSPERSTELARRTREAFRSEEIMANMVAAALLMPQAWMRETYGAAAHAEYQNLDTVQKLAREADVSLEAAIVRLRWLFWWNSTLLHWSQRGGDWICDGEAAVFPWDKGMVVPRWEAQHELAAPTRSGCRRSRCPSGSGPSTTTPRPKCSCATTGSWRWCSCPAAEVVPDVIVPYHHGTNRHVPRSLRHRKSRDRGRRAGGGESPPCPRGRGAWLGAGADRRPGRADRRHVPDERVSAGVSAHAWIELQSAAMRAMSVALGEHEPAQQRQALRLRIEELRFRLARIAEREPVADKRPSRR